MFVLKPAYPLQVTLTQREEKQAETFILRKKDLRMMYEYITLSDNTEVTHSHIIERDGIQTVEVHFERPKSGGFDSARCTLPSYQWMFQEGFSDEEITFFDELLHHNAHLFYRYAEQGGIGCA